MKKLETLTLTINALSEKIAQKKQFKYFLMKYLKEVSALFFNRSYFDDYFKCDVIDHLFRYCLKIQFLYNKEIVHIHKDEKIC